MLIVGNFSGWKTSTEVLPYDTSGIPSGVVVCQLPQYRWSPVLWEKLPCLKNL